jgi:hypothetical protein
MGDIIWQSFMFVRLFRDDVCYYIAYVAQTGRIADEKQQWLDRGNTQKFVLRGLRAGYMSIYCREPKMPSTLIRWEFIAMYALGRRRLIH